MPDDPLALPFSIVKELLKKNNQLERGSFREGQMKPFKAPFASPTVVSGFALKLAERCQTCKSLPLAPAPRGAELQQKEEQRPKLNICCIKWQLCGPRSSLCSFQPQPPCTRACPMSHLLEEVVLVLYFSFQFHSSSLGAESTPPLECVLLS